MDYAAKPFGLGQTYFGRTPTAAEQAKVSMLEGYEAIFSDTVQEGARLTNRRRRAVLVRNDSGAALSPGALVNWKSGYVGKRVGGKTGAGVQAVAGVVDPELNADVADGDLFWVIKEGPVTVTAAGGISSNSMITNAATGKVQTVAAPATATEAQNNAIMVIGLAMSSASANGDTLRAYVRFPF